ncbi:MAG: PAS domain S-box protein [Xanthobacteraceae bacterium]
MSFPGVRTQQILDLPASIFMPHDTSSAQWRAPEVLGQLLEALPTATYTTDFAGRITFYNRACVAFWGISPEIGKSDFCGSWRLYWPDGKPMPHDQCPMAVALRERRSIRGAEAIAERPDGTRVSFLAYPTALHNPQGELIGAINTLVDITDRKRTEALSDCQKAALQMLVDGMPLPALLEYLIDATERHAGRGMLGSILLLNDAQTHFVQGIGKSLPATFNSAVEGIAVDSLIGICCHAVRRRDTVVVPDLLADPRWAAFADFVRPFGLRAGWSSPIFGLDGKVLGTFANYYRQPCDPTPQDLEWIGVVKRTAATAIERTRAAHLKQRLLSIVESSEDAIVSKNLDGVITTWNPAAERMFGYKAEEIIGKSVTVLIPADQHDEEPAILNRVKRGERIDHYETIRRRKDGSLFDISLTVSPIKDDDGAILGASKIVRDITDRKRNQEKQTLLLKEMGHRVKNLFSVASGLVIMTARSARTPEEMAKALRERLDALARAHGLTRTGLIDGEDTGGQLTTLHSLIRTVFLPYTSGRECLVVCCPDVPIGLNALTGVAMVLHEFATNSIKYGALSCQEGFVSIDGRVESGLLRLEWQEHDGPRLKGSPDHEGFGGTLAGRTIMGQFGGQLAYEWSPEGVIIRISIPLAGLAN